MKLHYSKILLFSLPLNILVSSSSNAHNNKPYIKAHTATTTWRVLRESDLYVSNYDNDAEMKSVKENFDRQTSQRFDEYEEHMKVKRQKRKEERDKNIEEIIKKDKMEKSLAEKIEKGCVRCGCALGGVAASVGLFGELGIYGWNAAATATAVAVAKEAAMAEGAAAAKAKGAKEGVNALIKWLGEMGVSTLDGKELGSFINPENYTNAIFISKSVQVKYNGSNCLALFSRTRSGPVDLEPFCTWLQKNSAAAAKVQRSVVSENVLVETTVKEIVAKATTHAEEAVEKAIEEATATLTKQKTSEIAATCMGYQTAIIASVCALLIIALVMIIIYLVLRYRRKKKMNKKAQYTKLLNQ
ncbi:PIR protein, putative [Plasmodium sp. gorilla clade G1]|nr:PIR protein, putative [Plasmodium sp. gorilla clade G1]